jgi:hypothetical protein
LPFRAQLTQPPPPLFLSRQHNIGESTPLRLKVAGRRWAGILYCSVGIRTSKSQHLCIKNTAEIKEDDHDDLSQIANDHLVFSNKGPAALVCMG